MAGSSRLSQRGSVVEGGLGALSYLGLYINMVKFEHTIFALPFAYVGAFLAEGAIPGFWRMFWITVAMVGARSLAMALNRLLDAEIDAMNPRTAVRELPAGRLSRVEGWVFSLVSLAVLITATFNLPEITRYLWPLVVLPFLIYPLTKRWTWLCHLFLGATIGLGPVGAWVAVTGEVTWEPFLLGGAVALWIAGFDIIYSFMDVSFDRSHGIHSVPADLGYRAGVWLPRVLHTGSIALLALTGLVTGVGWLFFAGVLISAGLLAYENWLVREVDLAKTGMALMTMNSIISVVFFVFATGAVLLQG